MKSVLFVGGLCGTTMLRAAEIVKKKGYDEDIHIKVTIHNVWESECINTKYDAIVEMFPYFESVKCPLFNGKPFISHIGEARLVSQIIDAIKET